MANTVVNNHTQLAAAVADMTIDSITFGANIELEAPISIPASKKTLVFDGTHNGVTYSFTDLNSNSSSETLNINWASSISLTFQNMTMIGRNFYGIPCISEIGTNEVSVTYRNITYVGPQLAFNSQGLTHFENVDITILPSSVSPAQEVGEVCRVEFAGTNNVITHNSTSSAVFWFRGPAGAASFKLLPNAVLKVDTTNYFMYSSLLLTTYPVAYAIQQDASFTLNSHHGISYDERNFASSFLVETGATFRYNQAAPNGNHPSLYLTGGFAVDQGAKVYMQADFDNSLPLIHYITSSGTSLTVNNPKSFVLYDRSAAPVSRAGTPTRTYSITAEQLNHWTSATAFPDAGTFTDIAQNRWHNTDWAVFSVNGNINSSSTTASSTGLINPTTPISNFSYQTARVISAGNIYIAPDTVVDNGRPITGLTEPNAKLIIKFTINGADYTFDNITAGVDGRFALDPKMPIPVDTVIQISVNTPFLIKDIETIVVSAGEITIVSAPTRIVFKTPPVATNPVLLRRLDPYIPVKISDTRPYSTEWKLLASITGPLRAASGEVLENAVIYRDENEVLWDLSETPISVHIGGPGMGDIDVIWAENRGILVRVTQPIRSGVEYLTRLEWAVEVID